jgi:hypothetical protein
MARHGRNRHALPGMKVEFAVIGQIYGQATAYDNEQFIGGGMIVPAVRFIEHRQSQTAGIYLVDDHVTVRLDYSRAFYGEVDYL